MNAILTVGIDCMSKIDRQVRFIINEIERQGDPHSMTKVEWIDFLEGIITECEFRLEAARAELEDKS